jgi:glycerol-3-phosphate cytidylyltransferase-like family protein
MPALRDTEHDQALADVEEVEVDKLREDADWDEDDDEDGEPAAAVLRGRYVRVVRAAAQAHSLLLQPPRRDRRARYDSSRPRSRPRWTASVRVEHWSFR